MSVLQENLAALADRHPRTRRVLRDAPKREGLVTVLSTPSGAPTALLDGISVHSRYDPVKEAAAQAEREGDPTATLSILIGFGLGYGAEALRAKYPSMPILVLEPEIEIFQAAIATRRLTGLLADGKTVFLVGGTPEEAVELLESLPVGKVVFLRSRPAMERNRNWCRAVEETIRSFLLRREININTLDRFGKLWVRNLSRNLRPFLESAGISSLEGMFKGLPALVIAGGPSFDAVAPRMRELAERMILVAVNTPLKPCIEAGASPDFTVVVDPQFWASRYLDWTGDGGCVVAEPSAHPRVFRRRGAQFFLCSSLFPLGERLEDAVGEKGRLGAGGSVATTAWDLARHLGANPIYTAGLDLGFPGSRTHCRGVFSEDEWFSTSARLVPVEGSAFRALHEIGVFPVRSASGGVAHTDRRMLLYKWWFENQLKAHPAIVSRTLSPESAGIAGMPLAGIDEVLALPKVRLEIDARMRGVRSEESVKRRNARGAGREALEGALAELRQGLEDIARLSRRATSLSEELGVVLERGGDPGPSLAALDAIDRGILEISERSIAGFLIQPIIHMIAGTGERTGTREEVIDRSVEMYRGIAESAAYQGELLARAARSIT